jgi:multidrug efflux system membrane fusion protein
MKIFGNQPDLAPLRLAGRLVPAAALLLSVLPGCKPAAPAAIAKPAVPVRVALAARQDVPRLIESVGAVQALRTVSVKSQVDGIIAQIHFKEGDEVQANDPLVTLDRRPLENTLKSARADLANANAMAAQAQADYDRYKGLFDQKAVSPEEWAQYVTKNDSAQAQVKAREAAVANAELQLGYTEIRAPIAGRTGQLLLHEGALVKANDSGSAIVTLNQLAPIAVAFAVPERTLGQLRAALAASQAAVTVTDRATGVTHADGHLEFVDNAVDATTGMITLKAVFPNADHALWPGQFVQAVTRVGLDRDAIVVPSTAVQTSQNGSTVYVVKADQTADLRPVKVIRVAGDLTLLAEGVAAGETVVTDGQLRLLPGAKTEVRTLSGQPVAKDAAPASDKKS